MKLTESQLRQFIGYLSGAIPELNQVEVPRLAEAWETFKETLPQGGVTTGDCGPMVATPTPIEETLIATQEHFQASMQDNQALVQVARQRVDQIVDLKIELHRQAERVRKAETVAVALRDRLLEIHALAHEYGQEIPAPWSKLPRLDHIKDLSLTSI